MRISKKQREFLSALANTPRYIGALPCICISNMPESIWFTFRTEYQAYEWVRNLADRGFMTIEKEDFARITEQGLSAIIT